MHVDLLVFFEPGAHGVEGEADEIFEGTPLEVEHVVYRRFRPHSRKARGGLVYAEALGVFGGKIPTALDCFSRDVVSPSVLSAREGCKGCRDGWGLLRVIGVLPDVDRFCGVDDVFFAQENADAFGAFLDFVGAFSEEFLAYLDNSGGVS